MSNTSSIEQFIAITGVGRDVAASLLEACNNNVEMAIGMHLDGGAPVPGASASGAASASALSGTPEVEEEVRAPIPQKRQVLVEEQKIYGFRRQKRKLNSSVFDGFRDFQAEIDQQENGQSPSTSRSAKFRRLEDLFRPPIDLLFKGSFHAARDSGTAQNRWLLVNVQNVQEFACQVLNRDVWSNASVREMVKQSFVLWQVYHDSEEGKKFTQFYPLSRWPHIAIIDPRTGEKLRDWSDMDAMSFCDLVGDFLLKHPNPEGIHSPGGPAAKRARSDGSILDSSEDNQLQAAIAASVHQQQKNAKPNNGKVKPEDATRLVLDESGSDSDVDSDQELETFSGSEDGEDGACAKHMLPRRQSPVKLSQSPKLERQLANLESHRKAAASSPSKRSTSPSKCSAPPSKRSAPSPSKRQCPVASSSTSTISSSSTNSSVGLSSPTFTGPESSLDSSQSGSDIVCGGSGDPSSQRVRPKTTFPSSISGVDADGDTSQDSLLSADSQSSSSCWRDYMGNPEDGSTSVLLKFPDGKREQLTLPVTSQLMALTVFIAERGFDPDKYELFTHYPRKNLSSLDSTSTLRDCELAQQTVFIHER